jgi:hypothetical protein
LRRAKPTVSVAPHFARLHAQPECDFLRTMLLAIGAERPFLDGRRGCDHINSIQRRNSLSDVKEKAISVATPKY